MRGGPRRAPTLPGNPVISTSPTAAQDGLTASRLVTKGLHSLQATLQTTLHTSLHRYCDSLGLARVYGLTPKKQPNKEPYTSPSKLLRLRQRKPN